MDQGSCQIVKEYRPTPGSAHGGQQWSARLRPARHAARSESGRSGPASLAPQLPADVRAIGISRCFAIRYSGVDINESARKHGDIVHAIHWALYAADQDDAKVLYLGPDAAGNLLEVITVLRDDTTELVIHAMKMRPMYEPLLRELGGSND